MVLFHEDDCHFNLVVSKNSDLARLGSLSYRFNVGPTDNSDDEKDSEVEFDNDDEIDCGENQENIKELIKVKKELKKCIESKNKIEKEYLDCEKELRNKTEEVEKNQS